ncbi:spondin domain-containing protein [Microbulbifer sp. 2205BS26-8]|uniref:spondin domain-containing protein n=1 Tax=Microbulbifer sp. 2205BS26-8 TaxID=3064386 RepID=UPI00273DECB6|nr:spondin domain-containing protein [Microbulbifer sp. 2205BS26-8]MDP5208720.1 spondin domain-containing protein [Microbulbifer sp. 2205BS26-8]
MKRLKLGALLVSLAISALLTGCDSDNNDRVDVPDNPVPEPEPVTVGFEVTVTNLTHGQPLSPIAVVAHGSTLQGWTVGEPSSSGLELLAEGGDNSEFLMAFEDAGNFASISAEAPLGPGGTDSFSLSFAEEEEILLTVATMLVNTNDAFSGVTRIDISALAVGESLQRLAPVYDAGTEFNSELAGTIPGPADGGEGFNAEREDTNFVARHPGIVSRADGYTESVLNQSHRFDQPAMLLSITRTE